MAYQRTRHAVLATRSATRSSAEGAKLTAVKAAMLPPNALIFFTWFLLGHEEGPLGAGLGWSGCGGVAPG